MDTENSHTLLSTKEVAERFGLDTRTVQRRAERGDLEAQKMPGAKGAYVFDASYIEELEAQS